MKVFIKFIRFKICFKVKTEKITVKLGKIIITSPLGHQIVKPKE